MSLPVSELLISSYIIKHSNWPSPGSGSGQVWPHHLLQHVSSNFHSVIIMDCLWCLLRIVVDLHGCVHGAEDAHILLLLSLVDCELSLCKTLVACSSAFRYKEGGGEHLFLFVVPTRLVFVGEGERSKKGVCSDMSPFPHKRFHQFQNHTLPYRLCVAR